MFQRPFEPHDVGGAKSEFPFSLEDEEPVGKLTFHESVYDGGGAVWTSVVDDQDMETFLQAEDGTDDFLDILFFVISRYDNDTV